jgi:hypothetical protein
MGSQDDRRAHSVTFPERYLKEIASLYRQGMIMVMNDHGIEEKLQDWFFTFGQDHAHPNSYVKFKGTFMGARRRMLSIYGQRWSGQYDKREIEDMARKYRITEYVPSKAELGIVDACE